MADFTVTTLTDENDGGAGGTGLSLREALALANGNGSATSDTITFAPGLSGGTLFLTSGQQLSITTDGITVDGDIDGNGTADITIDADSGALANDAQARVFSISNAAASTISATLNGLVIRDGDNTEAGNIVGGGVFVGQGDALTLTNATVTGNFSGNGGGIGGGTDSIITVVNSTVSDNVGLVGGGGIYGGEDSNITVVESTISGNTSLLIFLGAARGGGILVGRDGSLSLTSSTVSGNQSSGPGGGIGSFFGGVNISLINSTVAGNQSTASFGGGIDVTGANASSTVTLTNSTVSGNLAATVGGGLSVTASVLSGTQVHVALANSIIAGNTGISLPDVDFLVANAPRVYSGGNIIGGTLFAGMAVQQTGIALTDIFNSIDPATGGGLLADNGGQVATIALDSDADNPAINTGTAALPADAHDLDDDNNTTEALPVDARGQLRSALGTADLGAFEVQSINEDPVESANAGLTLDEGASGTITATELDFDDAEQADGEITYTITAATTNGTLFLNSTALGLGDTFSQADIGNGDVTYTHDDSETTADSLAFDVSDGQGGTAAGTFAFTINPVNDAPAFTGSLADGSETVTVGENTATATPTPNGTTIIDVNAVDGDGGAADAGLTYAITAGNTDRDGDSVLPFAIDAAGVITVNDAGDLDHEAGASFVLTVEADDGGATNNTATATVTVNLTDQAETFTVTTSADQAYDGGTLAAEQQDGGGLSLREALALANAGPTSADTITFAPELDGETLFLSQGQQLVIRSDLTIDGDLNNDGTADITVSAAPDAATEATHRVFLVAQNAGSGISATLDGLVVRDGNESVPMIATSGGGIEIEALNSLELINSVVTGNAATIGGGIFVGGDATLRLIGSTVSDNDAQSGGGIALGFGAHLELTGSSVSGNTATATGGGISGNNFSSIMLTSSTIAGNEAASDGGGIFAASQVTIALTNSTVVGNASGTFGGGITGSGNTSIALVNSTMTGNSAGSDGGGITSHGGSVTLTNSIAAGNAAAGSAEDLLGSSAPTTLAFAGGNIIGSAPAGFTTSPVPTVTIDGTSQAALESIFADVALVDPDGDGGNAAFFAGVAADNGGPVQTVALKRDATNPALDGGDDNFDPPTDARGFARYDMPGAANNGANISDIGAFEIQNSDPTEAANLGANVDEGDTVVISQAALDFDDAEQGDGEITYTITTAPANGTLVLGTTDLNVGDSFTQTDITNGNLSYTHDGTETTADSFAFDVSDGAGGTASGTFALTINPLNDQAGGAAGGSILYIEDQAPTALDSTLTVTDPDDTHLEGARVAITGNFAAGQDVLGFTSQFGITGSYDAATGVLTLAGHALLAEYETVLRSVTYFNGSQNPSDAARTVAFEVDDGGGLAPIGNVGVNVVPVLDPPSDINGDHTSDIVWRDDAGTVAVWEMNGVDVLANNGIATIPNYWHIVDADSDFDGDGRSDILWRDDAGVVVLWTMDGPDILSNTAVSGAIADYWNIADTGDFTGDGRADILWRDDAGRVVLWEMDGADIVSNTLVADVATTSRIEDTADFTGDGMNDILWRDQDGTIRIWEMDGATVVSDTAIGTLPDYWHVAGTGDFNADSRFDILWRDDAGTVVMWEMDGPAIIGNTALGTLPDYWFVADTGDYTGDLNHDILWRDDAGTIVLWEMNGPTILDNSAVNTIPTSWHIVA